jgi:RHH-type proline utilization regulon transcriptional repressor/proline dehydrogenase/delta 1-pyrroline-5-carboxylate dehydrogenase
MNRFSTDEDLEKKIKEIGSEIIDRLNRKPSFLSALTPKTLTDTLISLSFKNQRLKTSLFRFIDVLPSLRSDHEVIEIFLEYLGKELDKFPAPFRQGLKWVESGKSLSPIAARSIRLMVESLSSRFILGKNIGEATPAVQRLQKSGRSVTIDLLGEATLTHSEGIAYQNRYLDLLEHLHRLPRDGNVGVEWQISVKLSSLNHRFDPADWENSVRLSAERLRPVFEKAKALDIGVILDMESFFYKDLIIKCFTTLLEEEPFREKPLAGIAIQTYLENGLHDLDGLISWAQKYQRPILVRLVKGAYWDYEVANALGKNWQVPVLMNKGETDLQFEAGVKLLLDQYPLIRPVIGSHNIRTISATIAMNELLGLPKEDLEFQMLYGMAEPLQLILAEMGYRVRVYAPTGEILPGMAYLIRRLMENSANNSILHQTFSGQPASSELLNPPGPSAPDALALPRPPHLLGDVRNVVSLPRDRISPLTSFRNEPPLNFSLQETREKVISELNRLISEIEKEVPAIPLIINGKMIYSKTTVSSVNPSFPDQILGNVSQAGVEEGEAAVRAALLAYPEWKRRDVKERVDLLRRVARHFRKIRPHLIALEILEVGKTWKEADGDICEAIDFLNYYADEMVRLQESYGMGRSVSSFPGEENRLFLQPLGIMAAISPWNFPLALATGMIAAGLVAGNCVIFKPSSLSQLLGARLVDGFLAEGVPPGVLQFLPGEGREIGEFLIQHPDIPLITFTGSNDVGRHILEVTSRLKGGQRQFKKVIAEMGGKNAIIIDESADLDEAIQGVIESAFGFQGQKCSACSRAIIHQNLYQEFVRRLGEAAADIVRGDPRFPSTFLGPVIDRKAREKIESYIQTGMKEAKTVYYRKREEPGYFIGPAVFEEVPLDSALAQEEIFGPVLSLFKAENFDEALKIANDSLFALTGGVYSRKPSHLQKAREQFHAGNLYLNRKITGAMVGRHPFGGFNLSGVGMKTGGPDYLLQFLQVKSISENSSRRGYIPEEPF